MSSVSEIENLLGSLEGVISARAVVAPEGRPVEIHILATPELHPKQVVRNVESALTAGLGIEVDRKIISVSQLRPGVDAAEVERRQGTADGGQARGAGKGLREREANGSSTVEARREPAAENPPAQPAKWQSAVVEEARRPATGAADGALVRPSPAGEGRRLVFAGFRAQSGTGVETVCEVFLRRGEQEFTGSGAGPDTSQGRIDAAARATLEALKAAEPGIGLAFEGAATVSASSRSYVMVSAHAMDGRVPVPLVGVASVSRSPEEAAVLAALQATNRWIGRPSR